MNMFASDMNFIIIMFGNIEEEKGNLIAFIHSPTKFFSGQLMNFHVRKTILGDNWWSQGDWDKQILYGEGFSALSHGDGTLNSIEIV